MNRCNVCIEEECKGSKNCNCSLCNNASICNKIISPTIRITKLCTQQCEHCCFECSPDTHKHMNIDVANDISFFLKKYNIDNLNIMGGEFFLNPEWKEILTSLMKNANKVRIVSNGDWVQDSNNFEGVPQFLSNFKNLVNVGISFDKYHNNKNVKKAISILNKFGIKNFIQNNGFNNNDEFDNFVVPIGNSIFDSGTFFSMFGTYCSHNPYSFLIDEDGEIYKCPFGIWNYANIYDFIEQDDFISEFKRIHKIFYDTFISNCRSCIRMYNNMRKSKC